MGSNRPIVRVVGAGPAGSAAAITALQSGAAVEIFEKSALPRHKVCGEFLSPESVRALQLLGVWDEFAAEAAPMRRLELHFERTVKSAPLPETAWGYSRFALDRLLLRRAVAFGARLRREAEGTNDKPVVIAHGRLASAPKGSRLFGFKAHFSGPVQDAVELYFLRGGGYAGVSPVENGTTNVCGLAPESLLQHCRFNIDALIASEGRLQERLKPLERQMEWLHTGPLVFQHRMNTQVDEGVYLVGDALAFVDPFTGSGLTSALLSGQLAGRAAALGTPVTDYLRACRAVIARPFRFARLFRFAIDAGLASKLSTCLPAGLLFRATRPRAYRA